jgi:hypothetical protein
MPLHDLIFSAKLGRRLQRHLIFWVAWWIYFSFCDYLYQLPAPAGIKGFYVNVGSHLLVKTFLLAIVYSIACYAIIYYLMPLIVKRNWLKAVLLLVSVEGFLSTVVYFLYWNVFPLINLLLGSSTIKSQGAKFWPAINLGLIAPLKIIASAVAIKYVKSWWLKQKESERLEKEKINTDLQLLRAQVHPDFLFKTLTNIHTHALSGSPTTPGMLLKLSDLLSYMLYDCDQPVMPLEKEIDMMKEYMQLEKISHYDAPEMEVNVKGDPSGKDIAPFLLLPFIENSFKHSQTTEQFWINMDIKIDGNYFSMKLTNAVSEIFHESVLPATTGLANVQKRLALLYPGKHDLKMTSEQEMSIVFLNIQLDETITNLPEEEKINSAIVQIEQPAKIILEYASH